MVLNVYDQDSRSEMQKKWPFVLDLEPVLGLIYFQPTGVIDDWDRAWFNCILRNIQSYIKAVM